MKDTADTYYHSRKETYTSDTASSKSRQVVKAIYMQGRPSSRFDDEMSPTHLSKSLVRHSHRSPIRSFKTPEGMRKVKEQVNSVDRLTIGETFFIDREEKFSKSSKKHK